MRHLLFRPTTLGLLAGVLYNSWLMAYWLNGHVVRIGLSSDLEASGQPYNWLFIGLDVVTAVLMLAVAWRLRARPNGTVVLVGYAVFAVMTVVSALLPLHCSADIAACGFQAGQRFGMHDLASGLAALGLFVSLSGWWWLGKRSFVAIGALAAYMLTGLIFLWATLAGHHTVGTQQVFLILSGVTIWLIPRYLSVTANIDSGII